jgi:hypothetical protein
VICCVDCRGLWCRKCMTKDGDELRCPHCSAKRSQAVTVRRAYEKNKLSNIVSTQFGDVTFTNRQEFYN